MNTTIVDISCKLCKTKSAVIQDFKSEFSQQIGLLTSLACLFVKALFITLKLLFFGISQLTKISLNIARKFINFSVLICALYLAHLPLLAYEWATKTHLFQELEQTSKAPRTEDKPEKLLCLPPALTLFPEPSITLSKHLPLIIPHGWEKWTRKKIETEIIPLIKMKTPTFTSKKFKRKSDLIKAIQAL